MYQIVGVSTVKGEKMVEVLDTYDGVIESVSSSQLELLRNEGVVVKGDPKLSDKRNLFQFIMFGSGYSCSEYILERMLDGKLYDQGVNALACIIDYMQKKGYLQSVELLNKIIMCKDYSMLGSPKVQDFYQRCVHISSNKSSYFLSDDVMVLVVKKDFYNVDKSNATLAKAKFGKVGLSGIDGDGVFICKDAKELRLVKGVWRQDKGTIKCNNLIIEQGCKFETPPDIRFLDSVTLYEPSLFEFVLSNMELAAESEEHDYKLDINLSESCLLKLFKRDFLKVPWGHHWVSIAGVVKDKDALRDALLERAKKGWIPECLIVAFQAQGIDVSPIRALTLYDCKHLMPEKVRDVFSIITAGWSNTFNANSGYHDYLLKFTKLMASRLKLPTYHNVYVTDEFLLSKMKVALSSDLVAMSDNICIVYDSLLALNGSFMESIRLFDALVSSYVEYVDDEYDDYGGYDEEGQCVSHLPLCCYVTIPLDGIGDAYLPLKLKGDYSTFKSDIVKFKDILIELSDDANRVAGVAVLNAWLLRMGNTSRLDKLMPSGLKKLILRKTDKYKRSE